MYLHVPFCRRRCYYCDFSIKVIGDRESSIRHETEEYTKLLINDIVRSMGQDNNRAIETIYFGGGTPSLLPNDCVERIMKTLHDTFDVKTNAEITFEMDPLTFDMDKVKTLKSYGINRISLGIQSFDDEMLACCGRAHRYNDILKALNDITGAGIDNYSIDLISALPKLSLEVWENTLNSASNCGAKVS